MPFTLYLTGAPATGKTSTAALLSEMLDAELLSYGQLITDRLEGVVTDQDHLRAESAKVISPALVEEVDRYVSERVSDRSRTSNLIVDSHAITAEHFGFRAVPYSADSFREMGFSHVVVLTAPARVVSERVGRASGGRPLLTLEGFEMHAQLQSSLALTYAHTAGLPIAFVDTSASLDNVATTIADFVGKGVV